MKTLATVIATLVVLPIIAMVCMYSGIYNFAASKPHSGITLKMLGIGVSRSVARHARRIKAPQNLSDPGMIKSGSHHFKAMCVQCHGAPGVQRSEMGRGLYPQGPDLAETAKDWTSEQLYWITKNGIKMSGMPAWGLTSDDHELWSLVAFMRALPSISPQQYQAMTAGAPASEEEHEEHEHQPEH